MKRIPLTSRTSLHGRRSEQNSETLHRTINFSTQICFSFHLRTHPSPQRKANPIHPLTWHLTCAVSVRPVTGCLASINGKGGWERSISEAKNFFVFIYDRELNQGYWKRIINFQPFQFSLLNMYIDEEQRQAGGRCCWLTHLPPRKIAQKGHQRSSARHQV